MKTLVLIRHATAETRNNSVDYLRRLTQKGKDESKEMAVKLFGIVKNPGAIISSSANRAFETAEIFAKQFDFCESKIMKDRMMYDSSLAYLISRVTGLDKAYHTVFLAGHNPEITLAVNYFCRDMLSSLPKCGFAVIKFELDDWIAISRESGILQSIEYPKK
ncbi:MAG: histidine phosphatase family protein [Prevotellaceae bacterium]|jgi:phosphohistidine phosphatase|nr:histidine phosphatase family protein [Prevotellaceae bacterium]